MHLAVTIGAIVFATAPAAAAPSVGAAFSGGGLTAFIETLCTLEALAESPGAARWTSNDWTAAVNSGGTLGYMLAQSLSAGVLVYPPFSAMGKLTYTALSQKYEGAASQKCVPILDDFHYPAEEPAERQAATIPTVSSVSRGACRFRNP